MGSQESDKRCHLLLGPNLGNSLDTRLTEPKRTRNQAGEMNGEGNMMAEICQTGQCDGRTGRKAGRSHEPGFTEGRCEDLGLWEPSNPDPNHFSTLYSPY